MKKQRNICDYIVRLFVGIMMFFFVYILLSFVMINICYERLGINNPIINHFLGDTTTNASSDTDILDINWQEQYPFSDDIIFQKGIKPQEVAEIYLTQKYIKPIMVIKNQIDVYTKDKLPFKTEMVQLSKKLENSLGYNLQISIDANALLYMENGYLTDVQPKVSDEDITEIANSIEEFKNYLSSQGIPFLYVNAGSKVCQTDKQLPPGSIEYSNENADVLLAKLSERNIDYLDFRHEMLNANLDWYDSYYKTDHHWTTNTGLWAAGVLANKLNKNYGFHFNENLFQAENYEIITYDNYWIGSRGRKDAFTKSKLEEYNLIIPKYPTNLTLTSPSRDINLTGNYKEVMLDMENLKKVASYTKKDHLSKADAYSTSQLKNDALTYIRNHFPTNNPNEKILFLQDSFFHYSTGYLATDVSKIDVIYPNEFDGSIQTYIEETKPNIVLLMYYDRKIGKIDWSNHLSPYDLR